MLVIPTKELPSKRLLVTHLHWGRLALEEDQNLSSFGDCQRQGIQNLVYYSVKQAAVKVKE